MAHLLTKGGIGRIADHPEDTSFRAIVQVRVLRTRVSIAIVALIIFLVIRIERVQVISIKQIKTSGTSSAAERYRLIISDGEFYQQAMLTTRLNGLIRDKTLCKGCLIELIEYVCNTVQGRRIVIIMDAAVKHPSVSRVGAPRNVDKRGNRPSSSATTSSSSIGSGSTKENYGGSSSNNSARYGNAPQVKQQAPAAQQQRYDSSSSTSTRYGQNNAGFGGRYSRSNTGGGAVQQNSAQDDCIPINQLNPYRSAWTIKARVTSKSQKKTWNNARGEGVLFSVDLLDADGSEIRGTFFKEAVDKFYDFLKTDHVYTFSGGRIKMANRQYSSLNCDYEITFSPYSAIQECPEDKGIKKMMFNFVKSIESLQHVEAGSMIDVIGVVRSEYGCQSLTTKTGRECKKRDLELVDLSKHSIRVTLWGERAEKELADYARCPVIALKGVKLGDYGGRSIGTYSSSIVLANPEVEEAFRLRSWFDQNGRNENFTSISSGGGGGGGGGNNQVQPISSIKTNNLGHGEKADWVTVNATLLYTKSDRAWYEACPEMRDGRQCNKKVISIGGDMDGPFTCEKCNKQIDKCQRRYILNCQFCDHTGVQWCTIFNDEGEKLLKGKTADEMNLMMESDHQAYKHSFNEINFNQYRLTLRVKSEIVNDENRLKATVHSIAPVDYAADAKRLLLEIDALR